MDQSSRELQYRSPVKRRGSWRYVGPPTYRTRGRTDFERLEGDDGYIAVAPTRANRQASFEPVVVDGNSPSYVDPSQRKPYREVIESAAIPPYARADAFEEPGTRKVVMPPRPLTPPWSRTHFPVEDGHRRTSRPKPRPPRPPPQQSIFQAEPVVYDSMQRTRVEEPITFETSAPGRRAGAASSEKVPQDASETSSDASSRGRPKISTSNYVIFRDDDLEFDENLYRDSSPTRAFEVYDDFQFICPQKNSETGQDNSDLDLSMTEEEPSIQSESELSWNSSLTNIHSSKYDGDAELGGLHNVTLTVKHGLKSNRQTLFQWLHIHQKVMSFNEFWGEVSRHTNLSEVERKTLAKLRADVKKQCIKTRYNLKGEKVGYMDPRAVTVKMQRSNQAQAATDQVAYLPNAKWICIPYFSLQRYSGMTGGSDASKFPNQTLLQAKYSRTTQKRDLDQAVCQQGISPKGECFHICQLWCLVLDNSLLVTCGEMPKMDLQGGMLTLSSELSPSISSTANAGRFTVKYSDAVVWQFPAEDCSTWFAFISHFFAFWPKRIDFEHLGKAISAPDWSKLVKYVGSRYSIELTLKVSDESATEPHNSTAPKGGATEVAAEKSTLQGWEPFHVLDLMVKAGSSGQKTEGNIDTLSAQLQAAESFLTAQMTYSTRSSYEICGDAMREDIVDLLKAQSALAEEKKDDSLKRQHDEQSAFFTAADAVYSLFLTSSFRGPTSKKYWGAIRNLTQNIGAHTWRPRERNPEPQAVLRELFSQLESFQYIMGFAPQDVRSKLDIPRQFVTAWLHILSGLVTAQGDGLVWQRHLAQAKTLMSNGMRDILNQVSSSNLLNDAVILPLEVVSLISMQLFKDSVGKYDDVCETYSQYLNFLDTDITSKPSDRSYQHKIDLVQQEMVMIRRTMARQRWCISTLKSMVRTGVGAEFHIMREDEPRTRLGGRSYANDVGQNALQYNIMSNLIDKNNTYNNYLRYDEPLVADLEAASKLSPTDICGFRSLFLAECGRLVEQREYEFQRYTDYAQELERAVAYKMEWTKDRQENAVYAFTIVTIIFLPLSSIAGIFGMNTTDVRDMEYNQWLYWVVALPVTFLVIIIGLWWMNELGNIFRWVTGKQNSIDSPVTGYTPPSNGTYYVGDTQPVSTSVEKYGLADDVEQNQRQWPVQYVSTQPQRRHERRSTSPVY